ncbi:MAG TPA: Wzz/FepE/Etk N-terminal domain-containing protein, partial [Candidatus Binataceae bacterium]|nr:Wzz/FepE/Etk N-terminal domain-containing protein [Candidatus Binataceae bacterium]
SALPWPLDRSDVISPLFYWRSLWRWRLWLIAATLFGAALGLAVTWLRTPTYRAETVLRPIPAPEFVSQYSFANGLLGLGGKTESDAYRYISIITSHQFLFRLIDEHGLTQSAELTAGGSWPAQRMGRWSAYRALKRAMEVQFDRRQGNIVIDLRLANRRLAEDLLVWMLTDLREQLRKGVLDECEASNRSLEDQARRTPDDIVRQEIFQQMAYDLQRAALAKVQADFAFAVIDPPLAEDRPADLGRRTVIALTAMLALIIGVAAVWTRDCVAATKGADTRSAGR